MPGFLGGSSGSSGSSGEIIFPKEFIDPVTKLRVSQPENLIDTDFEYGLQPTKWETVELINNTPSFFSKSGDTTIPGIVSISTNTGTREITVTTATEHGLAVGIPINVTGTKSVTADGSYVINSIPNTSTFTYLCKDVQNGNNAIEDLYSSIITGEFFQGSQIRIADSDGIVTDAESISTLTVKTDSTHGFGLNTPFYFLNLNSTISQEFEASNTAAKSFDSSNSATAQTFDGSNTLSTFNIDWSNSATLAGVASTISSVETVNDTITVSHAAENFANQPLGTPLYYSLSVPASNGYFLANPRGVVFLKTITALNIPAGFSTFQVSATPDGDVIDIVSSMSGTFQLANQARTFAGNNRNQLTEIGISVIKEADIAFDGGNQGYAGAFVSNGVCSVEGYAGTILVSVTAGLGLDYYVGAMVRYNSSGGSSPVALVSGNTYFIASFVATATPNQYRITLKEYPTDASIITPTGGTATVQTFTKIGVSVDKDIVHIKDASFVEKDMIEYIFPVGGRFGTATVDEAKIFYFVATVYDAHNYKLNESLFSATAATGGVTSTHTAFGVTYRTHTFTTVGSNNFVVASVGTQPAARFMMIAGGASGGARHGGGGGAGGMIEGSLNLAATTYPITIGAGGAGRFADLVGLVGGNTTFNSLTALGGGGGGAWGDKNGIAGGSGGGGSEVASVGGAATQPGSASGGFGFAGAAGQDAGTGHGSGGGGAGSTGTKTVINYRSGPGGAGRSSTIYGRTYWFAGGGGGGAWEAGDPTSAGQGGAGGGGGGGQARAGFAGLGGGLTLTTGGTGVTGIPNATGGDAGANTGGGGGGGGAYPPNTGYESTRGGNGGSGIVVIRYPITPVLPITYTAATGGTLTTAVETGITYNVHTFSYSGATAAFTVTQLGTYPDIEIFAYGAGGGGGQPGGWVYGSTGGAGGFATARHTLTSPKTYAVLVGGAGANAEGSANGLSSNVFTIGGGAPSRPDTGDDRYSGQGGGLSGFFDNNSYTAANAILIAGGGGGGGSSRAGEGNMGGAGGFIGQDGRAPYQGQAYAGKGGTQSSGGANPTAGSTNSTVSAQLTGGITGAYGGGGGGGWWGGSAGSYVESNTMGGGGGGSSYAHPTKTTNALFETGHYLYAPSTAFRSSDSIGRGGFVSSAGQNGYLVIRYPIAVAV
jgi:hypothetical protein